MVNATSPVVAEPVSDPEGKGEKEGGREGGEEEGERRRRGEERGDLMWCQMGVKSLIRQTLASDWTNLDSDLPTKPRKKPP